MKVSIQRRRSYGRSADRPVTGRGGAVWTDHLADDDDDDDDHGPAMAPRFGSGVFTHKIVEEDGDDVDRDEAPVVSSSSSVSHLAADDDGDDVDGDGGTFSFASLTRMRKRDRRHLVTMFKFACMGAGANWVRAGGKGKDCAQSPLVRHRRRRLHPP
jgi:hypothetical protein